MTPFVKVCLSFHFHLLTLSHLFFSHLNSWFNLMLLWTWLHPRLLSAVKITLSGVWLGDNCFSKFCDNKMLWLLGGLLPSFKWIYVSFKDTNKQKKQLIKTYQQSAWLLKVLHKSLCTCGTNCLAGCLTCSSGAQIIHTCTHTPMAHHREQFGV